MTVASFGIALVGLIVSIITFMVGNEDRKSLRLLLGGGLLLITLIFAFIGVVSLIFPESTSPRIIYLEDVEVAGKDSDGTSWHIPSTGTYIITLKSGAYNGWENDEKCEKTDHAEQGCWKTTIFIYRNREIDWIRKEGADLDEPGNPDFRIGDDDWQETEEIAAEIARLQDSLRIDLQQGECLKFVAIDGTDQETGWSAYSDNRGIVILDVSYLSP